VAWSVTVAALPVFSVLVARFVILEVVEPSTRLSPLASLGYIDLMDCFFIQILLFQFFVFHLSQC
jgi:hypothetical protein